MYTRYLAHHDREYTLATYESRKFDEDFLNKNKNKVKDEKIFYRNWLNLIFWSKKNSAFETKRLSTGSESSEASQGDETIFESSHDNCSPSRAYFETIDLFNSFKNSNFLIDLIQALDNGEALKLKKKRCCHFNNYSSLININSLIECLNYLNKKFQYRFTSFTYHDFLNADKKKILSFLFLIKSCYETPVEKLTHSMPAPRPPVNKTESDGLCYSKFNLSYLKLKKSNSCSNYNRYRVNFLKSERSLGVICFDEIWQPIFISLPVAIPVKGLKFREIQQKKFDWDESGIETDNNSLILDMTMRSCEVVTEKREDLIKRYSDEFAQDVLDSLSREYMIQEKLNDFVDEIPKTNISDVSSSSAADSTSESEHVSDDLIKSLLHKKYDKVIGDLIDQVVEVESRRKSIEVNKFENEELVNKSSKKEEVDVNNNLNNFEIRDEIRVEGESISQNASDCVMASQVKESSEENKSKEDGKERKSKRNKKQKKVFNNEEIKVEELKPLASSSVSLIVDNVEEAKAEIVEKVKDAEPEKQRRNKKKRRVETATSNKENEAAEQAKPLVSVNQNNDEIMKTETVEQIAIPVEEKVEVKMEAKEKETNVEQSGEAAVDDVQPGKSSENIAVEDLKPVVNETSLNQELLSTVVNVKESVDSKVPAFEAKTEKQKRNKNKERKRKSISANDEEIKQEITKEDTNVKLVAHANVSNQLKEKKSEIVNTKVEVEDVSGIQHDKESELDRKRKEETITSKFETQEEQHSTTGIVTVTSFNREIELVKPVETVKPDIPVVVKHEDVAEGVKKAAVIEADRKERRNKKVRVQKPETITRSNEAPTLTNSNVAVAQSVERETIIPKQDSEKEETSELDKKNKKREHHVEPVKTEEIKLPTVSQENKSKIKELVEEPKVSIAEAVVFEKEPARKEKRSKKDVKIEAVNTNVLTVNSENEKKNSIQPVEEKVAEAVVVEQEPVKIEAIEPLKKGKRSKKEAKIEVVKSSIAISTANLENELLTKNPVKEDITETAVVEQEPVKIETIEPLKKGKRSKKEASIEAVNSSITVSTVQLKNEILTENPVYSVNGDVAEAVVIEQEPVKIETIEPMKKGKRNKKEAKIEVVKSSITVSTIPLEKEIPTKNPVQLVEEEVAEAVVIKQEPVKIETIEPLKKGKRSKKEANIEVVKSSITVSTANLENKMVIKKPVHPVKEDVAEAEVIEQEPVKVEIDKRKRVLNDVSNKKQIKEPLVSSNEIQAENIVNPKPTNNKNETAAKPKSIQKQQQQQVTEATSTQKRINKQQSSQIDVTPTSAAVVVDNTDNINTKKIQEKSITKKTTSKSKKSTKSEYSSAIEKATSSWNSNKILFYISMFIFLILFITLFTFIYLFTDDNNISYSY